MQYRRDLPLTAIHIPKAGGSSVQEIFKAWFGRKLYLHYPDERSGRLPKAYRLKKLFTPEFKEGVCVYGHFNARRGFGVQDYYPDMRQFVTILRDPFELTVSEYFYIRKVGANWRDTSRMARESLESHLETAKPNMLEHFPFKMTRENYQQKVNEFIYVGLTEDMTNSVRVMALKLGFAPPPLVRRVNTTERKQRTPYELREAFAKKHRLEFEIYDYVKSRYLQ